MPDLQFGPIAPVLGAVLGALITASVTYFFIVKRKKILITIFKAEDVASEIRKLRSDLTITFESKSVAQLNRAVARIANNGNSSLSNINLRLSVPGVRNLFSVQDTVANNSAIREYEIITSEALQVDEAAVEIKIKFLNPREKLDLIVWFDGEVAPLRAQCRLEDVIVRIKNINEPEGSLSSRDLLSEAPKFVAIATIGIVVITTGINALYQYYSSKYIYNQQLKTILDGVKQSDFNTRLENLQKELKEQQLQFDRDFLRSEKSPSKP